MIDLSQVVMVLVALLSVVLVMGSLRKRYQRSARTAKDPLPPVSHQLGAAREVRSSLEETMLELDELSRQIHGRLDTKLTRLEALIRQADMRIERLTKIAGQDGSGSKLEITLDRIDPHETAPAGDDNPKQSDILRYADQGMTVAQIAQRTGVPHGEIELILALSRTRNAAAAMTTTSRGPSS